jgi:hypothetical protein
LDLKIVEELRKGKRFEGHTLNNISTTYHPDEFQYTRVGLPSMAARGTSSALFINSTFIVSFPSLSTLTSPSPHYGFRKQKEI